MQQRQPIKIADTREPLSIRQQLLETGWEQKALLSGDYFVSSKDFKKIGYTRKTIDDLLNSIVGKKTPDGTWKKPLPKQLEEMLDFYDINFILIEGSWSTVREQDNDRLITNRGLQYFTWDMIWDYLEDWFLKGFIPVLSRDEGETVHTLNHKFARFQNRDISRVSISGDYQDQRVLAFPSGCRGKTAIDALKLFGSIDVLCKATVSDLLNIQNVGQKKAELIWNHFHKGTEDLPTKEKEVEDNININPEAQGKLINDKL